MSWTAERVKELKDLWAKGYSASECARRLGGDVTRNAVIGKSVRLGLPRRATTMRYHAENAKAQLFRRPPAAPSIFATKPTSLPRKSGKAAIAVSNAQPIIFEPGPSGGVPFSDLKKHQCLYELSPIGTRPENFRFCAARRASGSPYCPHHSAIAYNGWVRKEEAA